MLMVVYTATGKTKMIDQKKLRKLIKQINSSEELEPKTLVEALEFSYAKWHPNRGRMRGESKGKGGSNSCGLCVWFLMVNRLGCTYCPLCTKGEDCCHPHHPYSHWICDNLSKRDKYADKIFKMIEEALEKELKKASK